MNRWTRLFYRLTILRWLSLRLVYHTAPAGTLFCELPKRVDRVNSIASLAVHVLLVAALIWLRSLLPLSGWISWPVIVGAAAMFLGGWWRREVAAVVGVSLVGLSSLADDLTGVALGAGSLAVWLLIGWELREAWRSWMLKPLYLESVNAGSAKVLRGKVRMLHLFLDTPRRSWRHQSRASVLRQIERACRWMIRGAQTYRVPLKFEHTTVNHSRVRFDGEVPTPHNDYAGIEELQTFLAGILAARSDTSAFQSDQSTEENCCLIVHVAEHIGQVAYAVPQYRGYASGPVGIEYAVVGAWRNAAVYVHEILHLFGAHDYRLAKYTPSAETERWDEARASMLWRSIMFDGYHALNRMVVDEQTAQCVGWL